MAAASTYASIPEAPAIADDSDHAPASERKASSTLDAMLRYQWRIFLWSFLAGCLAFGFYIVLFYGRTILSNRLDAWDLAEPGLYRPRRGDSNAALAVHLAGAGYAMLMGPLQFVPGVRRRFGGFHRANGRVLVGLLAATSLGGLYVVWAVGLVAAPLVGRRLNNQNYLFGACVLVCTLGLYYHAAVTKNIEMHERWAYRLAGLMFGNIYVRLFFAVVFALYPPGSLGEGRMKAIATFLCYTFFVPQMLLADWIWTVRHREREIRVPESSEDEGGRRDDSTTGLLGKGNRPSSRGDGSFKRKAIWAVVSSILLLTFLVALALQTFVIWMPFSLADIEDAESGGLASEFGLGLAPTGDSSRGGTIG